MSEKDAGSTTPEGGATPSEKATEASGAAAAASDSASGAGQQGQQGAQGAQPPGYTSKDIDKAAGAARADERPKAIRDYANELGFSDPDEMRTAMAEYRKQQDAQKTEAERIQGEYEKLQGKHEQASKRAKELESKAQGTALRSEARLAAIEVGARPDRVEALINQADLSGVTISEADNFFQADQDGLKKALDAALGNFPEWRLTGPQDVGEATSGPPAQEATDVKVDFSAMSDEEFDKYLERAKQDGIPLAKLR